MVSVQLGQISDKRGHGRCGVGVGHADGPPRGDRGAPAPTAQVPGPLGLHQRHQVMDLGSAPLMRVRSPNPVVLLSRQCSSLHAAAGDLQRPAAVPVARRQRGRLGPGQRSRGGGAREAGRQHPARVVGRAGGPRPRGDRRSKRRLILVPSTQTCRRKSQSRYLVCL